MLYETVIVYCTGSVRQDTVPSSVADPICLSRIPDPTFFHPGSELFPFRIPDPHQTRKKQKKRFSAQENMVRVFHPRSRIRMLTFSPSWIPDKGVKNQGPDPGRKNLFFLVFWNVTGILDGKNLDPGSRTNIPDPQHWLQGWKSAYLICLLNIIYCGLEFAFDNWHREMKCCTRRS